MALGAPPWRRAVAPARLPLRIIHPRAPAAKGFDGAAGFSGVSKGNVRPLFTSRQGMRINNAAGEENIQ
jgi:hypothetical protein